MSGIKVNNSPNGANTSLWKQGRDARARRVKGEAERSAEWWEARIKLHASIRAAQEAAPR